VLKAINCSVEGCFEGEIYEHGRCKEHCLEIRRQQARKRRANRTPERKMEAARQKRESRLRRRSEDPSIREREVAQKRSKRFKAGIAEWCTKSYLRVARLEDKVLTLALNAWLGSEAVKRIAFIARSLETEEQKSARRAEYREHYRQHKDYYLGYQKRVQENLTEEEKAVRRGYARKSAQRAYWKDPERERTRAQAFKHSRPDYRARWNTERGEREAVCSDGTLTQESVGRLFAASKCCPYCGDPYKKSRRSLDHIVPLAKANGRKLHSLSNVIVCCRSCNCKKHAKGLTQFLEELKAANSKDARRSKASQSSAGLFECHAS
jgi:5-methylcytosine-specific restriction endonuclease McrA